MCNKPARLGALLAVCLHIDVAMARETITRAEAELAVRDGARYAIADVDNHDLQIVRLKSPRNNGDAGFACGIIEPIGSPRIKTQMQSFHASLVMHDGVLSAIVAGLFMSIDELLEQDICR